MTKKDFKRTAVRRRGTTIAAAALSVALVAPFVHPVVAPQNAATASATPVRSLTLLATICQSITAVFTMMALRTTFVTLA